MSRGHYKRKNNMDEIFGTEITNVVTENTNITAEESVAEYSKMNLGTFCKSVGMETQQGKKMYHLEDAYGNVKKFEESQVLMNMKLGLLNVINLEISKNNKIIRKTPEALEVTYNNINDITYFPCLVKIFDLTTETEGTAVAVGYKNLDKDNKYETIINVVVNGYAYEATYKTILSQNKVCMKNSCIKCKQRADSECRFNRYGGGWRLCIEIKKGIHKTTYDCNDTYRKLLAVAKEDGIIKACFKETHNIRCWQRIGENEYMDKMKCINTTFWGGVYEYDVPVIDWKVFRERQKERLGELRDALLELCWKSANERYIIMSYDENRVEAYFKDNEDNIIFNKVLKEYNELNIDQDDIIDDIESYLKNLCDEKNKEFLYAECQDYETAYAVDTKGGFSARSKLQEYYNELVMVLKNECEYSEETINYLMNTNIWSSLEE